MNISETVLHRYEGNPIITPMSFPKALGTFNCCPVKYKDEYILLQPIQRQDEQVPAIYLARSKDGVNFTIDDEPFITRSKKFYNLDLWPIDPRVSYVPEDDMYYIMRPMNSSWGVYTLLLRTKDFKSVEEMEIVSLPNNRVPCLFQGKINGQYVRIDRPYGGAGSVGSGNMWISYSDDLIHWGEYRPLLKPWTNWGADKIGPTPPIKTKDGWLEIVHGVKERRYSLGAVLLDLEDPSKVIAKAKSPILTPNAPYEYMGHSQAPTVFACGALADEAKDEIRVYYGASDICVGLATGKLSELIDLIKFEDANFEDWKWC